jgi:hypothetical protein
MLKYLALIITLFAAPLFARENIPPFEAVQPCDTLNNMAAVAQKHGEQVLFNGQILNIHASGPTAVTEFVFSVNQDSGTWSLVSLWPNGWACLVANGKNFTPYSAK